MLKCGYLVLFVGLVDEQLAVGIEEEERVAVSLFHYPAAAILGINFHLYVFVADLLLGQKFVVFVIYL